MEMVLYLHSYTLRKKLKNYSTNKPVRSKLLKTYHLLNVQKNQKYPIILNVEKTFSRTFNAYSIS